MAEFTDYSGDERRRLNQRIHSITNSRTARELSKYRKVLCTPGSAEGRGAAFVTVHFEGRTFQEPEDLLHRLHRWLDQQHVESLAA